jgi:hypothetical protein
MTLPAVYDETIDAEILDARYMPDEPHDGVRPGMRAYERARRYLN